MCVSHRRSGICQKVGSIVGEAATSAQRVDHLESVERFGETVGRSASMWEGQQVYRKVSTYAERSASLWEDRQVCGKVDTSVGRSAGLSEMRRRCQGAGTLSGGGDVVRGRGRRQGVGTLSGGRDVTVTSSSCYNLLAERCFCYNAVG